MKLPYKQTDFIKLLERSPDISDEWRVVSPMLTPVTLEVVEEQPELYETKRENGILFIRLSESGKILRNYI